MAYLGLSGNSIATQRAFVVIACFFCGVILSRRALMLRSLALAALIVLALRPEALYSPGFQMSFAATIALSGLVLNYITGAVVSSVVAGLATALIAALILTKLVKLDTLQTYWRCLLWRWLLPPSLLLHWPCLP